MKMHDGEAGIDAGLVRRLVAVQFPRLAGLPVSAVRARGFALHQAVMIIPYYPETNPGFVTLAERTVGEVLADIGVRAPPR
ncbi:MAG TPA: hypothetical protein VH642_14295 [Streptosporangiaceae bacterium]|jgi:hypothetical protein